MYTQSDFDQLNAIMRKGRFFFGGLLALLAVSLVVGFVLWQSSIAILSAVVIGVVFLFFWDLKAAPYRAYNRLLRDMQKGLSRETEGTFVSIDRQPSLRDGVYFYALQVDVGQGDARKLYYDAAKSFPPIEEGQHVRATCYGNYIKNFEVL